MPAFLVHGVPDTAALWDRVRSYLQRDDIICHSMPGFGAPTPSGFEPTKDSYADWLVERVAEVGEPVDLVGHDWGSLLVQRVASLRPDLIRTLAFGSGPVDSTYVWHEMAKMWQTPGVGEEIMAGMTPDALRAGLVDQIGVEAATATAGHVDETMKRCILRTVSLCDDGWRRMAARRRSGRRPLSLPGDLGTRRSLRHPRVRRARRGALEGSAADVRRQRALVAAHEAFGAASALEELWRSA